MGKFVLSTINLYSDSAFTNKVATIPNVPLGIATGNTAHNYATNIKNNYTFFVNKTYGQDWVYLGCPYFYNSTYQIADGKEPQMWMPPCTPTPTAVWLNSYYPEWVFSNGYKIRCIQNLGSSSTTASYYTDNGTLIGSVYLTMWKPQTMSDGRTDIYTLVVSALNSDGTIPSNATGAQYHLMGAFAPDMYGETISLSSADMNVLREFFNAIPPYVIPTDPYAEIPATGHGGGDSNYDPYSTDDIDYELLPEVSAVGTGFLSLWCPSEQQMLDLSDYMWNADALTLDFWRKLVADPIQLVYGLNIIPLDLRDAGIVGDNPEDVVVGAISTGIKMDYLTSQWVELDCGTIDIEENMLGSYLDYDPFTKVDIYLPYIGYRPLRIDDIMPGTIQLKYRIDLLTGSCVAQIKSTKTNQHNDTLNSIVYQFMGNCATQVPVTASQYADAVRSAVSIAAAIGTVAVLAGTGAGAGMAAAGAEIMPGAAPAGYIGAPSMVPVDSELGMSMATYNYMISTPSAESAANRGGSALRQAGAIHSAASAGSNVMGLKPSIERSGAIGGAAGMLAVQMPYLVFTRPRIAHPEDQNKYTGYPSFITQELSELSGFTQVQAIHLEGLACTASELAELDTLLKSGVIF